jgi:hypothetical protein
MQGFRAAAGISDIRTHARCDRCRFLKRSSKRPYRHTNTGRLLEKEDGLFTMSFLIAA